MSSTAVFPLPVPVGTPAPAPALEARPLAPTTPLPSALTRACLAAQSAAGNKAQDVAVLDMRPLTPHFDFFVLATGASRRQVHAIVEEVDDVLRAVGDARVGVEGYDASKWVVQDYGDVLVHVFDPDTRAYYQLEELWADAPKVDWQEVLLDERDRQQATHLDRSDDGDEVPGDGGEG